jgi:outer membrane immunogenic protein
MLTGEAMKMLVLGSIALAALLGGPALGADLKVYTKAPPAPPPPVTSWAGYYVGAQFGAGPLYDSLTESTGFAPPLTGSAKINTVGVLGGGHFGYNWQFGNFVLGPEADIEGGNFTSYNTCLVQDAGVGNVTPGACFPSALGYNYSVNLPWQASLRGRAGYAWGTLLLYATGGVAFADVHTNYAQIFGGVTTSQSFDQVRTGYTVGAGLEYLFDARWIARVEYRYANFGTTSNAITGAGAFWNGYVDSHVIQEHVVRVGLSYLFGGPIVARY